MTALAPQTPQKPRNQTGAGIKTPRGQAVATRVICATPSRGRAVDNYLLGDRLGKGAFATVYKAIHLQTAEVGAIKQIPLEKIKAVDSVMSEIELLRDLEHPNIVKYKGFMKDDCNLNIVLEYCENGSLASILHKFGVFPENLIAIYMHQVLEGLAYLHRQGTIHRDIKGANILTTKEGVAKLADFGVATRIVDMCQATNLAVGVVGTPHWMAPEIANLQVPTTACDIWSLGATIVELRTGQPPFGNRDACQAMYAIVNQDTSAIIPADSSKSLRDILELCFEKDPALRVTAIDLLKHPWIVKFWGSNLMAPSAAMSPERAVQEWNSPSRRKRLAVPSMMNLKSALKKPGNSRNARKRSTTDADVENFEDDFDSLGVFGEATKRVTLAVRSPNLVETADLSAELSDFEDVSSKPVDNDESAAQARENEQLEPLKRKIESRKPLSAYVEQESDYEDDFTSTTGAEKREVELRKCVPSVLPPSLESKRSTISNPDPFNGLEDLLEDGVDEAAICAQDECRAVVEAIFRGNADLNIAFRRLNELVISKPVVRKIIEQTRLLPRVLALLEGPKDAEVQSPILNTATPTKEIRARSIYEAFLELVGHCIPENRGVDFVTNFCIAGGLSFVLSHSSLAPSAALRLVYRMCGPSHTADNREMSISRQLAFREDAVSVVCSFFQPSSSIKDLLRASSTILEMFRGWGPRHRANLWYHFNAYGLFTRLVSLLHTKNVLGNDSQNPVAENFYQLIVSYSRTPQELLSTTVNQKILRKLMRAYIHLPVTSKHRSVVLEFFKIVSTLPTVLDSIHRGNVVPHLIAALRRSLHDPRISEQQCYTTMNLLVPTLFNYSRIERSRQREVAEYGLLPLLQDCVKRSPRLREFVFPIFSALAHANHEQCWIALASADALQSFIQLITETGWQAMAILAIGVWMQAKPEFVEPQLRPRLEVINKALLTTTGTVFESILSATNSLLGSNPSLCYEYPLAGLYKALNAYLKIADRDVCGSSLVQALQIIVWVTNSNNDHKNPTRHTSFQREFVGSGLRSTVFAMEAEPNLPVMCAKLITQLKPLSV